jgi:hypothetical protein
MEAEADKTELQLAAGKYALCPPARPQARIFFILKSI